MRRVILIALCLGVAGCLVPVRRSVLIGCEARPCPAKRLCFRCTVARPYDPTSREEATFERAPENGYRIHTEDVMMDAPPGALEPVPCK